MSLDLNDGYRKPRNRRGSWWFMRIAYGSLAISAVFLLLQHPTWIPFYLWLAFTLFGLYWSIVLGPRTHARMLDQLDHNAVTHEFLIANDSLSGRSGENEFQHEWTSISGFRDSESLILLYIGSSYLPVSRRWFSNESDWERLVLFLGHRVEMLS